MMLYWQAVCNEFYNRYAKDYQFKYTTMRYYPDVEEEQDKKNIKRNKYLFSADGATYLTQREADCIYHMCLGLTIKETAEELLLSPRSVEFYLKRIKDKFGIQYKKDLLAYIQNHGSYKAFFTQMEDEFNA